MQKLKLFIFLLLSFCFANNTTAQSKQPRQKVDKNKTERTLNLLSKSTITNDNLKYHPEVMRNSSIVVYSNSLYYLAHSKSDSLKYNR